MQHAVEFQPQRYAYIQVYALGMASRPFEYRPAVGIVIEITGRVILEPGVWTFAIMLQIALAEIVVILQCTGNVASLLFRSFDALVRCKPFESLALLQPALVSVFSFLFGHMLLLYKKW